MERFEKVLEPYAELYANMNGQIETYLKTRTDDELKEMVILCENPNGANCWWAVEKVAPIVKHKAQIEISRRIKAGK